MCAFHKANWLQSRKYITTVFSTPLHIRITWGVLKLPMLGPHPRQLKRISKAELLKVWSLQQQ